MRKSPFFILLIVMCLLTLSTLSIRTRADVPYSYTFDNPNFQISKSEYDRYIRPQLKSILSDFYQLLRHVHPILRQFIPVKQVLNEIRLLKLGYTKQCGLVSSDKCRKLLSELLDKGAELESLIYQAHTQLSEFSLSSPHISPEDRQLFSLEDLIDSHFILLHTIDQMTLLSFGLLAKIEQAILFYGTQYQEDFSKEIFLTPHLRPLQIYLELFILDATPLGEREIFKSVWVNFIKKIETNILETDNTTYLLKNLGDLNFLWNDFHVRLTKSKNTISPKVNSLVLTIHNRWNSILRIILN